MSKGVHPTTVSVAGPILAGAMGLRWPEDRTRVVTYLNKFREYVYASYEELEVPMDAFHCICISTFLKRCGDGCADSGTYQGFTLPRDVESLTSVFSYGRPLKTRSRWREALVGLGPIGSRTETFEMAETFSTERGLRSVTSLRCFAKHKDDSGKHVIIDVVDCDGQSQRLDFVLEHDAWVDAPVLVREIVAVILPPGRSGSVTLAETDGYELSIYEPAETVPNYRRFKVATSDCPEIVSIQGPKLYSDIYFDEDIVEVGSRIVLEAAGRFFKYGEATVDKAELNRANYDRAEMMNLLKGMIARQKGQSVQDGTPFRGRPLPSRVKRLPGYHARR